MLLPIKNKQKNIKTCLWKHILFLLPFLVICFPFKLRFFIKASQILSNYRVVLVKYYYQI